MEEFRQILSKFKCEKGVSYTHTSIGNPKISLCIPKECESEFYDVYTRAMVKGIKLHLTEKPEDPSPMRIDLDFRFPMITPQPEQLPRLYTVEHLHKILKVYYEYLLEFLDVTEKDTICYVLEKPYPVENRNRIKDGIHIIFPRLIVPHSFQFMIRKRVLDIASQVFSGMNLCNPYEDVIDEAIIDRNCWQMYGSSKVDCEKYAVTDIYTFNKDSRTLIQSSLPTAAEELQLVKLLSMRGKTEYPTSFFEDKKIEFEDYVRIVLPTVDERRKSRLQSQIFWKSKNLTKNFISEDDYILARQLVLECLSPRRAENYEEWIKLGWTLRNIDHRLLEVWIDFSRLSSKFLEGECEKQWDNMRIDTMGMGTLRWWARQDNNQKYQELIDSSVSALLDQCINSSGAHFDVAKVVHALYKDKYRFTVKDTWYTFIDNKHRWVRTREGLKLRLILSCDVCQKFMERSTYWNQESTKPGVEELARSNYMAKSKMGNEICLKLKSAGYKNSVMTECKGLFTDEKFEELLDSHPHLIGFENGVYDLKMHEFRDGLPDDYISFTTGRYYINYDPESLEAIEINRYLSQVFTNTDVCKYIKDMLASIIDGSIRQEKFYIFTGSGCHKKDTEILMYDGNKKLVQDIIVGDVLMGDDSKPRNVMHLFRGNSKMYRIKPIKGDSFVVNEDHKISLKVTLSSCPRITTTSKEYRVKWCEKIFSTVEDGSIAIAKEKCFKEKEDGMKYIEKLLECENVLKFGDTINVQVKNYIHFNMKHLNLYLYKTAIDYPEQKIEIDPYILGCWLGDGDSRCTRLTTMDHEIVEYFKNNMPEDHDFHMIESHKAKDNKARVYSITYSGKRRKYASDNIILNSLRKYNLLMNKHIPYEYKVNSREVRLKILAGIIDTDGTYQKHTNQFTVSQKSEKLIDDIVDLTRSLGFACYKKKFEGKCHNTGAIGTYYRINIYGKGIETIPCLLPRKQAVERKKLKDALLNCFSIEYVGEDDYYGFEVDANHQYVMGDYHVTANSNSKSMLLNLIQKAIGDYYCILPIALLTQKRASSNSAQSELERTKGRRFAILQEPGESEKLNIGLMKELSGGDRILTRGLFKDPIEFKPQFTMIMTCNELPEVPSDDGGTWRRIRGIAFSSKFCENPNPNVPTEFPLDPDLLEKFDRWADTFISMIINYHSQIDFKNIVEPKVVKDGTESYKKNNDLIGQYVDEMLEYNPSSDERTQLVKCYLDFKSWVGDITARGCGKKMPDRNQFKVYLEKRFGVYTTKGWKGLIIKSSVSPDSDVD